MNRLPHSLLLALILGCLLSNSLAFGQLSSVGEPLSFTSSEIDESLVVTSSYTAPNIEPLLTEDEDRDRVGLNLRDAVVVPIGLDLVNSGIWFDLDDGSRVWRLRLKVADAKSLEAFYNSYDLPEGSTFFVFNDDGSEVFGSYGRANNKPSGRMTTEMVPGEIINFEYHEPADKIGQGVLSILDLGYRYREVFGPNGFVQDCQINVGCEEGDAWQDQVNSVVRIRSRINGEFFWCTGTVMNNTSQDCRPLILSSLSCARDEGVGSDADDFDYYRFYFNYQVSSCDGQTIADWKSIAGCERIADSNDGGGLTGSDFMLLDLSVDIPSELQVYYSGWNALTNLSSSSGVGVHHASGDVKKIATYSTIPESTTWGVSDVHWQVNWSGTTNGHGIMESGSNGSPLFDDQGRVIGTLTGGASNCNSIQTNGQDLPDFYGKMAVHWSGNPNPPIEKLKSQLDPISGTAEVFEGAYEPCLTSIQESEVISAFTLYPNPAANGIKLSFPDLVSGELLITDLRGRVLQNQNLLLRVNALVGLDHLVAGVYFCTFSTQSGVSSTQRFMISR